MITRSVVQESTIRCLHTPLVLSALAAVSLILQGCEQIHTLSKRDKDKPKIEFVGTPGVALVSPPEPVVTEQEVVHQNAVVHWQDTGKAVIQKQKAEKQDAPVPKMQATCDPIFISKSSEFRKAVQRDAQAYYKGVVNTFTLDFVRYPFCLENNYYVVHPLERKMRAVDAFKGLPSSTFEDRLNDTLTAQFDKNEVKWQTMCQDWADRNKAHQLSNLPMVRKVIGFPGDDDELKAQIKGFFNVQPWWSFFHDMAKSGCIRRYTQKCVRPAKVAHRHANELVMQTMGDRNMTWHEFKIPSDSLLQAADKVPIELKAGGQQFLPRVRPAV